MPDESAPRPAWRQVTELLQRTWIRNIAGLCVLAAIVGILFAVDHALSDSTTGPLDSKHPQVGEAAPLFALRDSSSNLQRLDDYRGRVVWINFWATTCGPCREELPAIQNVAAEIGTDKLVVLEVNQKESRERAAAYFREIGVDLPILFDTRGGVSEQYGLLGLPYNFFIDAQGVLRSFRPGSLTEADMRSRLSELGLTASGSRRP